MFMKEVLQIGLFGSSIKFCEEEWTFAVIFLSVIDTVFGCSLLIISEEGFVEENVENVGTLDWGFNDDVVAVVVVVVDFAVVAAVVVAVADDFGFPH